MTTLINAKIGEARQKPSIWMEGKKLAHGGLRIGRNRKLIVQDGH